MEIQVSEITTSVSQNKKVSALFVFSSKKIQSKTEILPNLRKDFPRTSLYVIAQRDSIFLTLKSELIFRGRIFSERMVPTPNQAKKLSNFRANFCVGVQPYLQRALRDFTIL